MRRVLALAVAVLGLALGAAAVENGTASTTFTQVTCHNTVGSCSEGCHAAKIQQGVCLQTGTGSSMQAYCSFGGSFLLQVQYPYSTACAGTKLNTTLTTDSCYQVSDTVFAEFLCPFTGVSFPSSRVRPASLVMVVASGE